MGLVEDYVNREDSPTFEHVNGFLESIINNYQFFDMIQIVNDSGVVTQVAPYRNDYFG